MARHRPELIVRARDIAERAQLELQAFRILQRAGMFGVRSAAEMREGVQAIRSYGPFAGSTGMAAARFGDRTAIVDDFGRISFRELEGSVRSLASAWRERGLGPGTTIGILCRNSRWPLIAGMASGRIGANLVWLNAEFAGAQCSEVCERETVDLLIHDDEVVATAGAARPALGLLRTASAVAGRDDLAALCAHYTTERVPKPHRPGKLIMLTSGTTGTPKGAPRGEPRSLVMPAAFVERLGLRSQEAMVVAPPLFHGTGLGLTLFSLSLGGTTVLRRRFDAATCIDDVARERATTLILVPVMLQRVLALGADALGERDLGSLRAIMCGGSRLPAGLAGATLAQFGEVLYNLYGSTEAALATMATPKELREAPDTAGRPLLGSHIRILDDNGRELPNGEPGRIFVRAVSPFEGYTGGGSKPVIGGYMSTGDVGHLDCWGRLYVTGRDDDMIVSGGENVFPAEVEDALCRHCAVREAAVVGMPDEEFGERLVAFVVPQPGADPTEDELREHVRASLARYKVPRTVVLLGELPRTATGKVLKRELVASSPG